MLGISLPQSPASVSIARHLMGSFLQEHHVCSEPAIALLILSELVTNAVRHGAEPIQVTLDDEADALRIEVSDGGDTCPPRTAPLIPNADETGGRGLAIVHAFAQRWGTTRTTSERPSGPNSAPRARSA